MSLHYNSEPVPFNALEIPKFNDFLTKPNQPMCRVIDSTRLMVEVLGGMKPASAEFNGSEFSSSLLLDGEMALVVRYKREKDGKYRPACTISFDATEDGGIHIKQIQGSNDKKIAYRFHASFNTIDFFVELIKTSFITKGIPVTVEEIPNGLECSDNLAFQRYTGFRKRILRLGEEHNGEQGERWEEKERKYA